MRKKIVFSWEVVGSGIERAMVIGGWLVKMRMNEGKSSPQYDYVFLHDQHHEWVVLPAVREDVREVKKNVALAEDYAPTQE